MGDARCPNCGHASVQRRHVVNATTAGRTLTCPACRASLRLRAWVKAMIALTITVAGPVAGIAALVLVYSRPALVWIPLLAMVVVVGAVYGFVYRWAAVLLVTTDRHAGKEEGEMPLDPWENEEVS